MVGTKERNKIKVRQVLTFFPYSIRRFTVKRYEKSKLRHFRLRIMTHLARSGDKFRSHFKFSPTKFVMFEAEKLLLRLLNYNHFSIVFVRATLNVEDDDEDDNFCRLNCHQHNKCLRLIKYIKFCPFYWHILIPKLSLKRLVVVVDNVILQKWPTFSFDAKV